MGLYPYLFYVPPEYVTSADHFPDDTKGEVTLQITESETREIFTTRAFLAKEEDDLSNPSPLTVLRGPHENTEEQWYIEIIETDIEESHATNANKELLQECLFDARTNSDLVNTRSEDVRALIDYLVEINEYDSVSEAVRSLTKAAIADQYPEHLEAYVEVKSEFESEELLHSFEEENFT